MLDDREALEWRDAKIAYLERSLREVNAAHEANTKVAIDALALLRRAEFALCALGWKDGLPATDINTFLATYSVKPFPPAALECAVLDALKSLLKRLGPGYYEMSGGMELAKLIEEGDFGLVDALNAWTKELPDDLA